ncbi:MAG: hypothetical protein RIF33_22030 [Cyclobacteriaceae bacterium]
MSDKIIEFNDGRKIDEREFTEKRNGRIIEFFEKRGIPIQLKGERQNPMIIIDEGLILSAYIKNFDLIFVDQPYQGEEIERVKLNYQNIKNYPVKDLFDVIKSADHLCGYRIKLLDHDLYLCGYQHRSRDNSMLYSHDRLYPVFGKIDLHVYKGEELAQDIFEKVSQDYDVELNQYENKYFI